MGAMKNTIKCCISCIFPCGALDVIRIVHLNGRVEEFSKAIRAGEVMKAHPKHVLRKSSLSHSEGEVVQRVVILPPDAELQRGKIYFLIPVASPPDKSRSGRKKKARSRKRREADPIGKGSSGSIEMAKLALSDQYLSEILSETQRDHRRGRVGVWRPHLKSISEASNDS